MISVPATAIFRMCAARFAVLAVSALLSACGTTPELVPVDNPERVWAERQVRLAAIEQWSAVGKLGMQSAQESWSAGLRWRQDRDSYRLRLSGPLGQGLMELRGSPGLVEMRTSDDVVYRARTAEELMQIHAGWRVPLSGLRYWIIGLPDPQARIIDMELDRMGQLAELHQLGWRIRYQRYAEFDGVALPTRLTLENSQLRAKLVVRSWRTGPDSS